MNATKKSNIVRVLVGLVIIAVCVVAVVYWLGRVEKYGSPITNRVVMPIKTIITDPQKYDGQTVTLEGVIDSECPTGCWFNLKDSVGLIYVDLNPSGFAIPQKRGEKTLVEGQVRIREGQVVLNGKGVEIR